MPKKGVDCGDIVTFFDDVYIRKCLWSSAANLKVTAASVKKFYLCLANHGLVKTRDYEALVNCIKGNIKDWQVHCKAYDSDEWPW